MTPPPRFVPASSPQVRGMVACMSAEKQADWDERAALMEEGCHASRDEAEYQALADAHKYRVWRLKSMTQGR